MAEIDVTVEALKGIRTALLRFQRDTELFPINVKKHIDALKTECEFTIREVQKLLCELRDKEEQLQDQIDMLEMELNNCLNELDSIDMEISALEQQIASLQIASAAESNNGDINGQARSLSTELSSCESKKASLENDRSQCIMRIDELQNELKEAQRQLQEIQDKIAKTEDKLVRLQSAYSVIVMETDNLCTVIGKFHRNALDTTEGNVSGLNHGINLVEQYMRTNL